MYIKGCAEFSVMPQACIPFSETSGICFCDDIKMKFLCIFLLLNLRHIL